MIITKKTENNPKVKTNVSILSLSKKEYAIIIGITGNTQGESTEVIPTKNEIINMKSINQYLHY
ncbi:MAG: hypothetical protein PHC65_00045 [Methanobacteriaceae archaeon]|jgi:hypothetical protein|uniref:hypothetical protein n=1 Tax=unclassified Methanobrevibacter TaxID=2638681 RepID=UPI002A0E2233|nr:hypothetical protein [Methanobacteriaceae archaeon]MDD3408471.1 hypothetical protein [Methanobacteriaceae archaeon]MDD4593617.1 hypothetical protein [Methanobacteriaceae archaeon]